MGSKDNAKRTLERQQFDTFLQLSKQSFDEVSFGEPPEPDVVAWRASEQIGVEITSFHRRSQKRDESEQTVVVDRAAELYKRAGAPNVGVHVMWAPHYEIKKRARQPLARDLALVVARHVPRKGMWTNLSWQNFNHLLMSAIDHVTVDRLIEYRESFWTVDGGGVVPTWSTDSVQAEIDRKNQKPRRYRERYAEVWLLLVSAFGAPSAWMEVSDEVRNSRFKSAFDRIYLLSSFPFDVFELNTSSN